MNANSPRLRPTKIVDKNGILTTRNKKVDEPASVARIPATIAKSKMRAEAMREKLAREFPDWAKEDKALVAKTIDIILSTDPILSIEEAFDETKNEAVKAGYKVVAWKRMVDILKEFHTEYSPTKGVNLLELDENDESLPWADRYRVKVANSLAKYGTPLMDNSGSPYGWHDTRFIKHLEKDNCHIREVTAIREDEWSEFQDTYAGNSEHHGIQGDAQCACGLFRGLIRMEETLEDFLVVLNPAQEVFDGKYSHGVYTPY